MWEGPLEKITDQKFRLPKSYKPGMRVDGMIYADENLLKSIRKDKACEQVANVAFLPGIVKNSLAMPDIHWGYGFSIGGVAATDPAQGGVISPGGVGFDINCGVRMLRTNLTLEDIKGKAAKIVDKLYQNVPSGVGSKGDIKVSLQEEKRLLTQGAGWAVKKGFGIEEDLECCEEYGALDEADPDSVSDKAYQRGKQQAGTLGSGNHFLEVQRIDTIFDQDVARSFGLSVGQITVMIHSGSRGLGYQVCDDYAREMVKCLDKYKIDVPDRQLACAPVESKEAGRYIGAMRAAANYAWANRQVLMHLVRESFEKVFSKSWQDLGMYLIYDVAHNIAKFEKYTVEGKEKTLCVHRKGATRALGPDNPALPERYRKTGQPVIIPGDMGRASYLLVGTKRAEEETFGSTCFTGDTKIATDKGIVTLEEIDEFTKRGIVYHTPSVNKDNLSIEWKPIISVNKRNAAVMRVSISQSNRSNFSTLDTTPDHNFFLFDNAELKFEKINSIIDSKKMLCVLDRLEIPWKTHDPRAAFLIGAIVTDGYIENGRNKRIVFTQKKTSSKAQFIDYVRTSFTSICGHELKEHATKTGGGLIRGKVMAGTATDYVSGRRDVIREVGNIIDNLQTWVLGLDRESTLNFLAGVIDGDGSWNPVRKVIDIFNSDEMTVGAIVYACLKLGILPYISVQRGNCFIIQISEKMEEILAFTKRVKFLPQKQKYGSKLFSVKQLFTDNRESGNIKWPFSGKAQRNGMMEADKIAKFLFWKSSARYNRENIRKAINSPLRMQRVRKVQNLGINEVYNIEVKDNHNYFALTRTFIPVLVKNCHGAGRVKSRHEALRTVDFDALMKDLSSKGVEVRACGKKTIVEEAPSAYKNVDEVVEVVDKAGLSRKVCRMRPLCVVKG